VRNTGRVSSNEDDEALTWAGGRDPSHYETPEVKPGRPAKPAKAATSPATQRANDGAAENENDDQDEDDLRPAMSGVVLVTLGILGGIYLLYTVGWFVSWQRLVYVALTPLDQVAFSVEQVLTVLAAPLWFGATLWLTRSRRPVARLLWLIVGALVLVPWPFTLGS
jgi:hypothetical protein